MAQEEEEKEEEENQRKKDVVVLGTSSLRLDAATSHWATTSSVMRDSRINGPPFHLRYHNAGRRHLTRGQFDGQTSAGGRNGRNGAAPKQIGTASRGASRMDGWEGGGVRWWDFDRDPACS